MIRATYLIEYPATIPEGQLAPQTQEYQHFTRGSGAFELAQAAPHPLGERLVIEIPDNTVQTRLHVRSIADAKVSEWYTQVFDVMLAPPVRPAAPSSIKAIFEKI